MHRSNWTCGAVAVLLALFSAAPASAQSIYIGGGPSFPMSDYGDYAKTGFMLTGGLVYPIGTAGLNLVAEGGYGQNTHSDVDGDKTNPLTVMGGLLYNTGGAAATRGLYAFGQAGLLFHRYSSDQFESETDSGFGFAAGGGYFFPLSSLGGWIEGRFTHAESTSFVGAMVGISIPLRRN